MLHPKQFQVNKTWIVFKLNDAPVSTDRDGCFNVYALMDAASCFILDTSFVPAEARDFTLSESKNMLENGHRHKDEYPKELIIPEDYIADNLSEEAGRCGIRVKRVTEEQLQLLIGEARQGFQEHISSGRIQ